MMGGQDQPKGHSSDWDALSLKRVTTETRSVVTLVVTSVVTIFRSFLRLSPVVTTIKTHFFKKLLCGRERDKGEKGRQVNIPREKWVNDKGIGNRVDFGCHWPKIGPKLAENRQAF